MFGMGGGEVLLLLVLGILLFGPEKLPQVAKDVGRMIRELRRLADEAKDSLGPEFRDLDLADLNPRTLVAKHLLADDEEPDAAHGGYPTQPVPAPSPRGGATALGEPAPYDPDTT